MNIEAPEEHAAGRGVGGEKIGQSSLTASTGNIVLREDTVSQTSGDGSPFACSLGSEGQAFWALGLTQQQGQATSGPLGGRSALWGLKKPTSH